MRFTLAPFSVQKHGCLLQCVKHTHNKYNMPTHPTYYTQILNNYLLIKNIFRGVIVPTIHYAAASWCAFFAVQRPEIQQSNLQIIPYLLHTSRHCILINTCPSGQLVGTVITFLLSVPLLHTSRQEPLIHCWPGRQLGGTVTTFCGARSLKK